MKIILHLDADAFFASVESSKNPKLRGLPIITGFERGIATSMSYEAKALGINRADPIFKIKKEFPQAQIVAGDYESYAIYSERMFDIVAQHTDSVDVYSIDECFAIIKNKDIDNLMWDKYVLDTISKIQKQIETELNISVSIGTGDTKLIAKIGSKLNKPHGLTIINDGNINGILYGLNVEKLWGVGPSSAKLLQINSIYTALEFKNIDQQLLLQIANKPLIELWHEINGRSKIPYGESHIKANPKSVSRTHSFVATNDSSYIYSELVNNIDNACYHLRRHNLYAKYCSVFIKDRVGNYTTCNLELPVATRFPHIILSAINNWYDNSFDKNCKYKSTGVTLNNFSDSQTLFELDDGKDNKLNDLYKALDKVNRIYGKGKVHLASSDQASKKSKDSYAQVHKIIQLHADGDYKLRYTYLPYLGETK